MKTVEARAVQQLLAAGDRAGQAETALQLLSTIPAAAAAALLAFSQPAGLQVGSPCCAACRRRPGSRPALAPGLPAAHCVAAGRVAQGYERAHLAARLTVAGLQIVERALRTGAAMMAGSACDSAWVTYAGAAPALTCLGLVQPMLLPGLAMFPGCLWPVLLSRHRHACLGPVGDTKPQCSCADMPEGRLNALRACEGGPGSGADGTCALATGDPLDDAMMASNVARAGAFLAAAAAAARSVLEALMARRSSLNSPSLLAALYAAHAQTALSPESLAALQGRAQGRAPGACLQVRLGHYQGS